MQKPIYNVYSKRNKLVAVINECTNSRNDAVSYNYIGKFAGCRSTLEECFDSFNQMGSYRFEEI
ncbi:hypothetical protein D3C85_693460 [compost metagenome]